MIQIANPLEVAPAQPAKEVSRVKLRSAEFVFGKKIARVQYNLGDMVAGQFSGEQSRSADIKLSTALMENIEGKIEAALKAKLATELGVDENDLTVV